MKIFVMAILFAALMNGIAFAHTVFSPEGKTLKIHWAVLEAKPGKFPSQKLDKRWVIEPWRKQRKNDQP